MLVGSFIQTQKFSVHRTLERRFRTFLTHSADYLQLLLTLLRGLLHDAQRTARLMGDAPRTYTIPLKCVRAHMHACGRWCT
jgi:hypothetical protein